MCASAPARRNPSGEPGVNSGPRTIYKGRIIQLDLESVTLPNGSTMELEIVRHPGGAAVVALDAEDRVCLLRQFRHIAGGWVWELPAGKLDPGEGPFSTAKRELEEEAGVQAGQWEEIGSHISSPGIFSEIIHLYLARDLRPATQSHEEHEVIEVHWIPFEKAVDMACTGEINDGKTLIGLLRARLCLDAANPAGSA
jgi:8-oxo-dGTP pyrophosphatase MutT (NUDIX family)